MPHVVLVKWRCKMQNYDCEGLRLHLNGVPSHVGPNQPRQTRSVEDGAVIPQDDINNAISKFYEIDSRNNSV